MRVARFELQTPSKVCCGTYVARKIRDALEELKQRARCADSACIQNTRHARTCAQSPPAQLRIPTSIHDVDNGNILGFGSSLSEDHPGFFDEEYKTRRWRIAQDAKKHRVYVFLSSLSTAFPDSLSIAVCTRCTESTRSWGGVWTKPMPG